MMSTTYSLLKTVHGIYALRTTTNAILIDIDILCRYRHPILLGAYQVLANDSKLLVVLPPAPLMLPKLLNYKRVLSTERLSILYSLTCGIDFLHQQKILCNTLSLDTIAIFNHGAGWYPVLTDFSTCSYDFTPVPTTNVNNTAPEVKKQKLYSEKSDIWALADIYEKVLGTEVTIYTQTLMTELLTVMRSYNPEDRPTASQLLAHPIFEGYASQPARLWPNNVPNKIIIIQPVLLEKHKLYLSILSITARSLFSNAPIALLFLMFELYYRVTNYLQTLTQEEQINSIIGIVQLAAEYFRWPATEDVLKFLSEKEITLTRDASIIRNELLQQYGGILYYMRLYRGCTKLADLIESYNEILLDRTGTKYNTTYFDIHYPEDTEDLNGYLIHQMFS